MGELAGNSHVMWQAAEQVRGWTLQDSNKISLRSAARYSVALRSLSILYHRNNLTSSIDSIVFSASTYFTTILSFQSALQLQHLVSCKSLHAKADPCITETPGKSLPKASKARRTQLLRSSLALSLPTFFRPVVAALSLRSCGASEDRETQTPRKKSLFGRLLVLFFCFKL